MRSMLLTGDSHISARYPYSTSTNPFNDVFFNQAYKAVNSIIEYANENGSDIIHAGDFLSSEIINGAELLVAMKIFSKVRTLKTNMYLNLGNHEIDYKERVPAITQCLAMGIDNIKTGSFEKPYTVFNSHGLNIYMMPYSRDGEFSKGFADMLEAGISKPACLCIHQNIKGIRIRDAVIKSGITEKEIWQLAENNFKFIVCGHIHTAYASEKMGMPFIIPGSTIAIDFNDNDSEKGFFELHLDEQHAVKRVTKHLIKNQIMFITKRVDEIDAAVIKNSIRKVVKIVARIDDESKFNEIKKQMMENGAIAVLPQWINDTVAPDLTGYERPIKMDIEDWLFKYMEKKGFNGDEIESAKALNGELFSK